MIGIKASYAAGTTALLLLSEATMGGPPMVTDDTGTAADGTVEIIGFAAGESRDAGKSAQAPALDVAFGINETVEIGFVLPRQRVKNPGQKSVTSWGEASLGLKWRFFDRGNRALAIAPTFSMPLTDSSTVLGIIDDAYIFTLPLLASIRRGAWELTGNLGYSVSSGTFDTISVSGSAGYQVTPKFRTLLEFWGSDLVGDGASRGFLNWRAGVEWAPVRRLTILGAIGGDIWSQLGAANRLEYDYYIGLQYVSGNRQ
ncbi:MAG: hypothetical protein R3192_14550 [Woeseiaceae bacterium]|nr:hypothetical protein [Woeseiaceae bacterium]